MSRHEIEVFPGVQVLVSLVGNDVNAPRLSVQCMHCRRSPWSKDALNYDLLREWCEKRLERIRYYGLKRPKLLTDDMVRLARQALSTCCDAARADVRRYCADMRYKTYRNPDGAPRWACAMMRHRTKGRLK